MDMKLTIEEVIEILDDPEADCTYGQSKTDEAHKIAIEALERLIPVKMIHDCNCDALCPECKMAVFIEDKFCAYCGKKLDPLDE